MKNLWFNLSVLLVIAGAVLVGYQTVPQYKQEYSFFFIGSVGIALGAFGIFLTEKGKSISDFKKLLLYSLSVIVPIIATHLLLKLI